MGSPQRQAVYFTDMPCISGSRAGSGMEHAVADMAPAAVLGSAGNRGDMASRMSRVASRLSTASAQARLEIDEVNEGTPNGI